MSRFTFGHPWRHEYHGVRDIVRWKLRLLPEERALYPEAGHQPAGWRALSAESLAVQPTTGWRVHWLGHAGFFLHGCGINLLIDPIFSNYCAPVHLPMLRRKVPPPCAIGDLPRIDAVLLTHSHYDHLDLPTLRGLAGEPRIFIAEGHGKWLGRKLGRPVHELPWWRQGELQEGVSITAVPAQHFTSRTPWDRNLGHWCGWLIQGEGCKLWHAGDSGYCPAFRELGERHGPIDWGMIPIGAYQPRQVMRSIHMNPEEAVQAFLDAGCRHAAAMHWGTFDLTDEPMQEPPIRLREELKRRGLSSDRFTGMDVGSTWTILPEQVG